MASIKEAVEKVKGIGNDLFKKGECAKALRKYKKAVKYLQHIDSSTEENTVSDEMNTELKKILISLYLNRYQISLFNNWHCHCCLKKPQCCKIVWYQFDIIRLWEEMSSINLISGIMCCPIKPKFVILATFFFKYNVT